MTRDRLQIFLAVVVLAAIGVTGYLGVHNGERLSDDERQTCTIQNRGLQAQPHLVRVMEDFNTFIQPPKGLKRPAPVPKAYAHALADVRVELPEWLALVKAQPKSRRC